MEVKKIVVYLLLFVAVSGSKIEIKENIETADYIGKLLRDHGKKEPTQVHDVVVANLQKGNEFFAQLVSSLVKGKQALLLPKSREIIHNQNVRGASFIIIIVDALNEVRKEWKLRNKQNCFFLECFIQRAS